MVGGVPPMSRLSYLVFTAIYAHAPAANVRCQAESAEPITWGGTLNPRVRACIGMARSPNATLSYVADLGVEFYPLVVRS